ncbi:MAG: hypothetical protein ACRCXM_02960 [Beijerinckiaceae bacterium]
MASSSDGLVGKWLAASGWYFKPSGRMGRRQRPGLSLTLSKP